ncbi:MAG: ABC transporter substrate-binding protein, partial [Syntrophothermus sp.]
MSKQKLSALISIGLVLALALGVLLPVAVFAADELKIGFLGALSGNVAIYGTQSLKGMKLAVEEINAAGGVLGKKLVIVEEDDRGDKTEVANIMQKYATQDKVIAVVGDPTTGATKVAA